MVFFSFNIIVNIKIFIFLLNTKLSVVFYFRFIMSWIVEQSDNTSAINVNGDTVTCMSDGSSGSPINVMYNDSADRNGEYFWEIEVQELGQQGGGGISVGLTTKQGFKSGWGLKAMKYLGNLSDG